LFNEIETTPNIKESLAEDEWFEAKGTEQAG